MGWYAWERVGYTPVDPLYMIELIDPPLLLKELPVHDHNGTPLKPGDIVNIPCIVTETYGGQDYCNVRLETIHGRKPDGAKETFSAINTAQVVLVDRPVQPDPTVNPEPPAEPTERVPE